jgi:superfamily I DNA/RNA helicase/intein/homing endonuclease
VSLPLNPEQLAGVNALEGDFVIIAGPGSGKCLGIGTPVLMFDGSIKPVEKVMVGDLLIGPDSQPRRVLSVTSGEEEMYVITPIKGMSWTCNCSHILALSMSGKRYEGREKVEIPIFDYLKKGKRFQAKAKLWRSPVIWPFKIAPPFDSYFLGLWLADGDSRLDSLNITSADFEIVDYLKTLGPTENIEKRENFCPRWKLSNERIREKMKRYFKKEKCSTKFIPNDFKITGKYHQLQLLAGLLDGDGHYSRGGFDFISKSAQLAEDVAFLCRSLGLAAYVSPSLKGIKKRNFSGRYFRVSISGDLSKVPTKIKRKIAAPRRQIKSVLKTGFKVSSLGVGKYYGFEITGDGLFLLGDFTVTHNTRVLVERYLRMRTRGIPDRDILNLTFTNAAATEMVERVGLLNAEKVFRTFHSFCLDLLKKERQYLPFKTIDTVIPVRGEQYMLMKDLLKSYPPITSYHGLADRIGEWKAENISPERALLETHSAGMEYFYALAYRDYEKKMREQGWLDFDSLVKEAVALLETNEAVRERAKRKYIAVDECQDTDTTQFRLLQLLYNGNIFVVGDENQCQPPGTLVDVLVSPRRGRIESHVEKVAIEELSETNDKLVSWDPHGKRIRLGAGRRFRRAVRHYDGNLLEIQSNGNTTRVTPNHFLWVKFNREALKKKTHFVYLMWRKDLGYRVGTSTLRTACGSNQISHRGYQEQADRMWILDVVKSGKEARTREEIYSLKYQIPERVFQDPDAKRIFSSVSSYGGLRLLQDKGLEFDHPLVSWDKKEKGLTKFHGYFKTAATNILEGLMDLPTEENYKSAVVSKVSKVDYHGPVYSLEVEKDHTYIADGIPVGNCIYEWRSAQAGNLSNFARTFPGAKTLYLGTNYRSTQALVEFFKAILPVDNGLASHMKSARQPGESPSFIKYWGEDEEANEILNDIADRGITDDTAILARTNRQLQLVQRRAMSRNMRAEILGKRNVWQENEVKHLIDLTKEQIIDPRPAAIVMQELIKEHNLVHRYHNTKANPMEKDPVENLNDFVRLAGRKNKATGEPLTVPEFLEWLRKITHARRKKDAPILTLATIHAAKGREWRYVYLVGCNQGILPHKDGELNEERRIFFVGCSRAADELQISFTENHSQFLNDFREEIEEFDNESQA